MELPEVHAHPHHTGHRWVDYVLAGSALLVSAISLWVAIGHGHTMEKLVEANSWPNVELEQTISPSGKGVAIEFAFRNTGVGPARLETLEFAQDGRALRGVADLVRALRAPLGLTGPVVSLRYASVSGAVIGARDRVTLIALPFETIAPGPPTMRLVAAASRITARWCYCSVFEDCYMANSAGGRPARIDACPVPRVPFDDDLAHTAQTRGVRPAPAP